MNLCIYPPCLSCTGMANQELYSTARITYDIIFILYMSQVCWPVKSNKEALALIVKDVRFWFPFYPPAFIMQLCGCFCVWMLQETLQNSKWACWWSSCQQIRSLSLRLCRLMLKPLNKSIVHTHADARRFSATIVEHYKILHKRAHLLEEGDGVCALGPRLQTLNFSVTGYCFVPAFQVVPSQRHWNWGRAALVDAGCPWQFPGTAQQEQPRGLYPLC